MPALADTLIYSTWNGYPHLPEPERLMQRQGMTSGSDNQGAGGRQAGQAAGATSTSPRSSGLIADPLDAPRLMLAEHFRCSLRSLRWAAASVDFARLQAVVERRLLAQTRLCRNVSENVHHRGRLGQVAMPRNR
jgi:hypothetical protein